MRFIVSPPFWYCLWWLIFFAVLVVAVRLVLINPLVSELRQVRQALSQERK